MTHGYYLKQRLSAYSGTKEATMENQGNKAKPWWKRNKEKMKRKEPRSIAGHEDNYPEVWTKPDKNGL